MYIDFQDFSKCKCERNTAGSNCEKCLPLFNNKPYRIREACEGELRIYKTTLEVIGLQFLYQYVGKVCVRAKRLTRPEFIPEYLWDGMLVHGRITTF